MWCTDVHGICRAHLLSVFLSSSSSLSLKRHLANISFLSNGMAMLSEIIEPKLVNFDKGKRNGRFVYLDLHNYDTR